MVIDDLQHRGHDSAQLAVIGPVGALSSQHVELVEDQHPRSNIQEAEDLVEVPCRLAQVR